MPSEQLTFEELSSVFDALAEVAGARASIGVTDAEIGRYARLVEYGSVAGERPWPQPGPRTTLAVNPETGEEVIVSAQAQQGFIRANAAAILQNLTEELRRVANWLGASTLGPELELSVRNAAQQAVVLLRAAAPRDTGALGESLQVVDAD